MELQTGVAPTQSQQFTLPAHTDRHWSEFFRPLATVPDPSHLHASYSGGVASINKWLDSAKGVPQSVHADVDAFLRLHSDDPVLAGNILHKGQPWGALHELATKRRLSPSVHLSLD